MINKNFKDYLFYLFRNPGFEKNHLIRIIIETIIVVAFIVYYSLNFDISRWYYLLFILFYFYEILSFYKKIKSLYFKKDIYIDYNFGKDYKLFENLCLSKRQKSEGWKVYEFSNQKNSLAMSSSEVNSMIQSKFSNILIKINQNKYKTVNKYINDHWASHSMYLQYKVLQSLMKNKEFTNDKKICLGSDLNINDNFVDIYIGSYYDSVLTNEACGSVLENIVSGEITTKLSIEAFTSNNGILELSASTCNNHIGVSTLAITKDKKMLLWTQNSRTMQNSNQITPTASGSLDLDDMYHQYETLEEIIIRGTNRELKEECQINLNNILFTKVVGFWRWLERGGKPEFSSISKINIDSSEIIPDISEVKQFRNSIYHIDITNNDKFEDEVNSLIRNPKSSLPLLMNLKIFLEYIKTVGFKEFLDI